MKPRLPVTCRLVAATAFRGFLHGLPQQCLQLTLEVYPNKHLLAGHEVLSLDSLLVPMPAGCVLRLSKGVKQTRDIEKVWPLLKPALERCHELVVRVQETAGWPVGAGAVVQELRVLQHNACAVTICFPSLSPVTLTQALPWLLIQLGDRRPPPPALAKAPTTLDGLLKVLGKSAPQGTNTRLLLAAAYKQGVPVQRLCGQVMLYGWGSRSRWMDSSFTDASPSISAKLARDKTEAHRLLRRAGFPVGEQVVVPSVEVAVAQAARIGFPVVIKPSNLDGGRGVEAGLKDEASLRAAFSRSIHFSKSLILEKHVEGRDFRLGVLNGQLTWATYREPAGVWGDGASTVSEPIMQTNQDPRRAKRLWSQMVPLTINSEARELLVEQGVTLTDIVPKGCFVQLRRAANISSGGSPVDVTDQVHPDNAALAVAVARLFRLDIAGIDFITPDIARSWRDVGGVICEVNGQPQFSVTRPDLAGRMISTLVKGRGRVPVIVILGQVASCGWTEQTTRRLQEVSIKPGWVLSDGTFSGRESLAREKGTSFDEVQALLLDTSLDALIIATDGLDWLKSGMPVDRVDLVVGDGNEDLRVVQMLRHCGVGQWWRLTAPARIQELGQTDFSNRLARFISERTRHAS